MASARDAMLGKADGSLDLLLTDYVYVRLADLISLTFCVGWEDEQRFGEWTVRRRDDRVIVMPDAFGGQQIPIAIDAREISGRPFRSDSELREAIQGAKVMTLRGVVSG